MYELVANIQFDRLKFDRCHLKEKHNLSVRGFCPLCLRTLVKKLKFEKMSNSHLFLKSGFPRANLQNGLGRYVGQLQRITIKYCKSSGCSKGVR